MSDNRFSWFAEEGTDELDPPATSALATHDGEASIIPEPSNLSPTNYYTSNPASNSGDVTHHGTRVVQIAYTGWPGPVNNAVAYYQFNVSDFANDGEIYAISDGSDAIGLRSALENFTNSGLIAAQAVNGLALGVRNDAMSTVFVNEDDGSILAEGLWAVGVYFYRGSPETNENNDRIDISNAGLIEAHSLHPGIYSIGLQLAHLTYEPLRIVNSGTIRADYAIYGDALTTATVAQMPIEFVINEAGGLIDGMIVLDRGDDFLTNHGQIVGYVSMGEGNDEVDTRNGVVNGIIDLGLGNDVALGSAGDDLIAGDNGDDRIEGNGGADLLTGGGNNDVLIGGAGNDGMFGEYGDDRLVTQGGDFVVGGAGNDRVELGDYTFEIVDGESGFDTLVLPTGSRQLDLATVVSENAIFGIEEIVLGGNKEIVVRSADIPALTDGTELRLDTAATDAVRLVGAWSSEGSVTLDGVSYRKFVLDGQTLLVEGAGVVSIAASSPIGAVGLDPIAGGPLAPLPGEESGMILTPNDRYLFDYWLTQSLTINPEEIWWNDGLEPVLVIWNTDIELTNLGQVLSISTADDWTTRAIEAFNLDDLINWGTVASSWQWGNPDQALGNEAQVGTSLAVVGSNRITNHGLIYAETLHGNAEAIVYTEELINYGHIEAYSKFGYAIASNETGIFENHGSIYAEAGTQAIGARFRTYNVTNDGVIEAYSATGSSIAVVFDYNNPATFTNNGEIIGETALLLRISPYSGSAPFTLTNNGDMTGDVELGAAGDSFTNNGAVDGDIRLGGGADTFNGAAGAQTGRIFGEGGADTITGATGAEVLVGGEGADTLDGGGGANIFLYHNATESTSASMDRIRNFQSGVDKINLRPLGDVEISWTQQTDSSDGSLYNLVVVQTPTGTMEIRVDGAVALADFIVFEPVYGTVGADVLSGTEDLDEIHGEAGADLIEGLAGHDSLFGGSGSDVLGGGDGNDSLFGGDDADVLSGGGGDDTLDGGSGLDIADYATATWGVTINLAIGGAHNFNSVGLGVDTLVSIEGVYGTAYADSLVGDANANDLRGKAGADYLVGGGGNDTLLGGDGDDILELTGALPASGAGLHLGGGAGYDRLGFGGAALNLTLAVIDDDIEYLVFSGALTIGAGDLSAFTRIDATTITIATAGEANLVGDQIAATTINLAVGGVTLNVTGQAGVLTVNGSSGADIVIGGRAVYAAGGNDQLTGDGLNNLLDGGSGADSMAGGLGNDTYVVDDADDVLIELEGQGDDLVQATTSVVLDANIERLTLIGADAVSGTGNGLANHLQGNSAANVLSGAEGNDRLDGKGGADSLIGGLGDDVFVVDASDTIVEGLDEGTDTVEAAFSYTLSNNLENLTLIGSNAVNGTGNDLANVITGNSGSNVLTGGGGADTLNGAGGSDTLRGGDGADVLDGGTGTDVADYSDRTVAVVVALAASGDTIITVGGVAEDVLRNIEGVAGGSAADTLTGNAAANTLRGNGGADTLDGKGGVDSLYGGAGDDTYFVDHASDKAIESASQGTDTVRSSVSFTLGANVENLVLIGSDAINGTGNGLDNTLTGNSAANVLSGGGGNDLLHGGGGDTLQGGAGNDIFLIGGLSDAAVENDGEGNDEVRTGLASYTLAAHVEKLTGTSGAGQSLTGNDIANLITGGAGADTLDGAAGDDTLDGGAGVDTLKGGAGNDLFLVNSALDTVIELSGEGTDLVQASVSFTLGAGVENLTLTGSAAINGTGNELANAIVGNGAANVLNGAAGADTLTGGAGNDRYEIDNAGDTVVELAAEGADIVFTSVSFTLSDNVENLTLTGSAAINGTGNDLVNRLYGNAGTNILMGGGGNDRLDGGAGGDSLRGGTGDDVFIIDDAGDRMIEYADEGRDLAYSSVTVTLGANVEDLILTGDAAVTGAGNALANRITGNAADNLLVGGDGADRLNGAGGADTMRGGLGDDLYYVDQLGDVIVEYSGQGVDTVIATITYGITSGYENITLAGSANIDATGNNLANVLTGNDADNVITGLRGADRMWGKGGADSFVFNALADSLAGQEDRIVDFDPLVDVIDLSLIDANTALAGNQAFAWAGAFSGQAGEAVLSYNAAANQTVLTLDANGDGLADFRLLIDGNITGDSGFIL